MQIIFIAVIGGIFTTTFIVGMILFARKKRLRGAKGSLSDKDRNTIIKESNRRLATNPKDHKALLTLADIYYEIKDFKKAMKYYQLLLEFCKTVYKLDEATITLRYGISCLHCQDWTEAYKALIIARAKDPKNFEINLNLAKVEFARENISRCVGFAKAALEINILDVEANKLAGQGLYLLKRYKDASVHLKKVVDDPKTRNNEILFAYACCEQEINHSDIAHKIFRQLRQDPVYGPKASLFSGNIFLKKREYSEASSEYQIGLQNQKIEQGVWLELKYQLAEAMTYSSHIDQALKLYKEIYAAVPDFKDVQKKISRHKELNSNRNLQIYLLSPVSDFKLLCQKMIGVMFSKSEITIQDVNFQKSDYIDISTDIKTPNWHEIVLFRFMRKEDSVNELFVRDFYGQIKEINAGRGFCLAPGVFSNEAMRFVEARQLELLNKEMIIKILRNININSMALQNQ